MKNVIFLQSSPDFDTTSASWKYWGIKNNIDVFNITQKSEVLFKANFYNKIALIEKNIFIKWDAPNFFELFDDNICGVMDTSDFKKIITNITNFKKNIDIDRYIKTDVLFFNNRYLNILNILEEDEQTSINYNISTFYKNLILLKPCWNLYSIHIKDMLKHNWQLNDDPTPSFIKYAYIWNFNDIPNDYRSRLISDVWDYIKNNYTT